MPAKRKLDVHLKRAYEPLSPEDGARILVDRLWPRGVRKDDLALDAWLKEIAPSTALRRWFGHDPERWREFRRRYESEIAANPALLEELRDRARGGRLTLIYAARDAEHNEAIVLRDLLLRRTPRRS